MVGDMELPFLHVLFGRDAVEALSLLAVLRSLFLVVVLFAEFFLDMIMPPL